MTNPRALVDELSAVLATEQRGLVRHVAAARPHVTPKTYRLFAALKRMAHDSEVHARRIAAFMQSHELEPRAVSFDTDVANFHFVTLESVLPELIAEKQRQIAAFQRAIEHVGQVGARAQLQALLEEKI